MDTNQTLLLLVGSVLFIFSAILALKGRKLHSELYFFAFGTSLVMISQILVAFANNMLWLMVSVLIMNIGLLCILVHYERIASTNYRFFPIFFLFWTVVLVMAYVFYILWELTVNGVLLEMVMSDYEHYWRLLFMGQSTGYLIGDGFYFTVFFIRPLNAMILFCRCFYIVSRANQKSHLSALRWESVGNFTIVIYSILFFFRIAVITQISLIISIIGITILILNNLRSPDFAFKIPIPILSIMVYNKWGLLAYSQQVSSASFHDQMDESLITGLFSGISIFIQESLGKGAKLHQIDATMYRINFFSFAKQDIVFSFITTSEAPFLSRSVLRMETFVSTNLTRELNAQVLNQIMIRDEMAQLIRTHFPYLTLPSVLE